MKTRYIILLLSVIFLSLFFISVNAQIINSDKLFNLGGVTYSPIIKQTTPNQSIFIAQEGTHKRVTTEKINSSFNSTITDTSNNSNSNISNQSKDIDNTKDITDKENYPPIYYESQMYDDIGYVPGFDPVAYYNNFKINLDATSVPNMNGTSPLSGTYHIPVLLVEFTDKPNTLSSTIFQDQFNSSTYLSGNGTSVKYYILHESYGDLNIIFDVYDWRTITAHNYSFYTTNPFQLVIDTVNLYGTGSNQIDFTQYDSDNDGRIDGFVILHAGYGGEEAGSNEIRSQTRIFKQNTSYSIQGKYYGNASIVPEKIITSFCSSLITTYGYPSDCRGKVLTEVHEFMHVLGLIDMYAINPTNGAQVGNGLGEISMMIQDAQAAPQKPINLDAWSKYFLGWINPTTIDNSNNGNYIINSIDTNSDAAYILRDITKMYPREYFIVTNRYRTSSNQDKWLFGGPVNGQTTNLFGGLEILHIDEQYIQDNYMTNSVEYDSDMNTFNDTISHPGIVFEQNILENFDYLPSLFYGDLYTTELDAGIYPGFGTFDSNQRLSPVNSIYWDSTSNTYNGHVNTAIKIQALSPSGVNINTYLQTTPPPFSAQIINPENNHRYKNNVAINFIESHANNTGNVSCVWKKYDNTIISSSCSFSATPQSFGINNTGCAYKTITLTETDNGSGQVVVDDVNIKVYNNIYGICDEMSNQHAAITD